MSLSETSQTKASEAKTSVARAKPTVFVDGASGTTGLGINERLRLQSDVVVRTIAEDKRKDAGAKRALMLQVSAPFHSALMAPAAEAMREALAGVARHAPSVPVVSNVTVAPTSDPDEITRSLVAQVTGRVRWRETVEWLAGNGVATLYEIGAGKVLSGLARRINRDVAVGAVGTPADVDAALAALA